MEKQGENRVEEVVVEEPHIKIGLQQVYDMSMRVAEGNQRLEAKIDTALSNQTIQMGNLSAYIVRVEAEHARDRIEVGQELDKLSERLRLVELSPKVTPSAMWRAVGALTAVIGVAVAIIAIVAK